MNVVNCQIPIFYFFISHAGSKINIKKIYLSLWPESTAFIVMQKLSWLAPRKEKINAQIATKLSRFTIAVQNLKIL